MQYHQMEISPKQAPQPLLSSNETAVLRCLARGMRYDELAKHLSLHIGHVHTLCHSIRKKTGISSTKDRALCREYWLELNKDRGVISLPPITNMPTRAQLAVLNLVAHGKPYKEIAALLGITEQTAMNHAYAGCQKIGLGAYGRYRVLALIEWMKKEHIWIEPDPLEGY